MNSSSPSWYWHRLRAMSVGEVAGHLRRAVQARLDAGRERDWTIRRLETVPVFPTLPAATEAPEALRAAVRSEAARVSSGHWRLFGHAEVRVDDPPKWQSDPLAGQDFFTLEPSFRLNYRQLRATDSKPITRGDIRAMWELNRWQQLTVLAQAGWLGDEAAARKCVAWLEDWVQHNPQGRGWNWTSALEAALRLIQFTWIDALLASRAWPEMETLRHEILAPHAWLVWRNRSFGSSANNHWLGELAGLITASVRWPLLASWCVPMDRLHREWERAVLAQFAEDGGLREQALHYHWFALDLCWHTRQALRAAGRNLAVEVEDRLAAAAGYLAALQPPYVQAKEEEPRIEGSDAARSSAPSEVPPNQFGSTASWDFGDSDDAIVTPLFLNPTQAAAEWRAWGRGEPSSALSFWWRERPPVKSEAVEMTAGPQWQVFFQSGLAACAEPDWRVRLDASPLGYLRTAAHGHLDALQVSLWFHDWPLIIDPGTGAYYHDAELRAELAAWRAHNGPHPVNLETPHRLGAFLWGQPHPSPSLRAAGNALSASLDYGDARAVRTLRRLPHGWLVEDQLHSVTDASWEVTWTLAPEWSVEPGREGRFVLRRGKHALEMVLAGASWTVNVMETRCSPRFRQVLRTRALRVTARGNPCLLRTTFLASPPS